MAGNQAGGATVMALAASFIGIAILLVIGPQILGNTTFDCTTLSGNATSGWQQTCAQVDTDASNAFQLLLVVMIVIAAVVVLFVVRLL